MNACARTQRVQPAPGATTAAPAPPSLPLLTTLFFATINAGLLLGSMLHG